MKVKYYWLQFLPFIGFIYICFQNEKTWSNYYYSGREYLGNKFHFLLSAFIQAISLVLVIFKFLL